MLYTHSKQSEMPVLRLSGKNREGISMKPYKKVIVLEIDGFESKIIDERNMAEDADVEIFRRKYPADNQVILIVYM